MCLWRSFPSWRWVGGGGRRRNFPSPLALKLGQCYLHRRSLTPKALVAARPTLRKHGSRSSVPGALLPQGLCSRSSLSLVHSPRGQSATLHSSELFRHHLSTAASLSPDTPSLSRVLLSSDALKFYKFILCPPLPPKPARLVRARSAAAPCPGQSRRSPSTAHASQGNTPVLHGPPRCGNLGGSRCRTIPERFAKAAAAALALKEASSQQTTLLSGARTLPENVHLQRSCIQGRPTSRAISHTAHQSEQRLS